MERFSMVMNEVFRVVYSRHLGGAISFALMQLINARLIEIRMVVQRLAAAVLAGAVRTRRSPPPGCTRTPPAAPAPGAVVLPRGFAWLRVLAPNQASAVASQLLTLVAEPEMAALLAASPGMVAAVKRLCWMLGKRLPPPYAKPLPLRSLSKRGLLKHKAAQPKPPPAPWQTRWVAHHIEPTTPTPPPWHAGYDMWGFAKIR
jgi:hypothetical protein